jgi:hypothetical protein
MTSVEPVDGADLRVGARFRIRQPGLAPMTWRVTQVRDGEFFVWESNSPGVRTVGFHGLAADPDGGTRITIRLEQTGVLAGLFGALLGRRIRRYLGMEAAGLKAASEVVAQPGA